MLKKTLIIIGAVFAGLIVLGIVGNMLPDDTDELDVPAAVVTVTATPAPTYSPTPEPEPTPEFTADEQANLDFIAAKYPALCDLTDDLREHCDEGDLTDLALMNRFTKASEKFIAISKRWNKIEWSYGATDKLEENFNRYMNATKAYYKNWLLALLGEGDWGQQVENIWKAEERIDKYGPRVEDELERLASESV